jgi:hypothetical protein
MWINVPSIAISVAACYISYLAFNLAKKRREDDLFDRRYEFYKSVRDAWLSTADPETGPRFIEDWIPIAEEASFLFGSDIEDHLVSLDGRRHNGSPSFPNEDFVEPFRKYLTLA